MGRPSRPVDAFLYPQGNQPPERAQRMPEPVIQRDQFRIHQMPVKLLQPAGPDWAVGSLAAGIPSHQAGQFVEAGNR